MDDLKNVIRESLLDGNGNIRAEELKYIIEDKGPTLKILEDFLKNDEYIIWFDDIHNFFYIISILSRFINTDKIISHLDKKSLANKIHSCKTKDFIDFFRTFSHGFELVLDIVKSLLDDMGLIQFLEQFENLIDIIPESQHASVILKITQTLKDFLTKGEIDPYNSISNFIKRHSKLFPDLVKTLQTTFKINKYITLKLEHRSINIYVNGRIFNQCKYLLINIPKGKVKEYDTIESIDEAAEISRLNNALEGGGGFATRKKYSITPETEFWGHCSNLQAWVESGYDTRLLHRNLAFPLLQRLAEVGDPQANKIFKEEIIKRLLSGYPSVITYLSTMGYLEYITEEDYNVIFEDAKFKLIENLIRGLGRRSYSRHVKNLLNKFKQYSKGEFTNEVVNMLETGDIEIYCGIRRSGYFDLIDVETLQDLVNNPNCIVRDFYYRFKDHDYFVSYNLIVNLSNKGINNLSEIDGLHRLRHIKTLDLRNNNLTSIFGLENLQNLKRLKLKGNPLPDELIEELGGLDMYGNANEPKRFVEYCKARASHQIDTVVFKGTKYEVINGKLQLRKLGIKNLNEIEKLFDLKSIISLDLSYNKIEDTNDFKFLPKLKVLNLCHNKLKNLNGIAQLKNLEVLRVFGNKIYSSKEVSHLRNLKIKDFDSRREVKSRVFLKYLLQSLTINEMNGICKLHKIKGYSVFIREKLIELIIKSLSEFQVRDLIRKYEVEIISRTMKHALFTMLNLGKKDDINKIRVTMLDSNKIRIIYTKWDKTQIKHITDFSSMEDPLRVCECKEGKNGGFCAHSWYGVFFAFKRNIIKIADWNLTLLPKNLEKILQSVKVIKKNPNEFCFINRNFMEWYIS